MRMHPPPVLSTLAAACVLASAAALPAVAADASIATPVAPLVAPTPAPSPTPVAAPMAPTLGSDLAGLLAHARAHHPELAAMRHEAEAAVQRIQPAGAWADPMVRIELENVNNYGNSGGFNLLPSKVGDTKYTLLQPLPLFGKPELRRDVAAADARVAEHRAEAVWSELAARLKAAHVAWYAVAANERLTHDVVDLMARLEQLAQARYAGGLVAQQDAIRAQLERTAMRGELIALESERRQAQARLNALLVREASAPLAPAVAPRPLPEVSVHDVERLVLQASARNPALAAEAQRLRSAEASRELTLRNRYPDIQVGISPMQMGSRLTAWSLMVEMNLPLQRESRRSQEREAQAMVEAQRSRIVAATAQLRGELGEHLAVLDAARRTEALIATQQLPQSELSLRSAMAAYETGKVDFATLLDAQRQIRKARQDRLKAQVEAQMRLAEIERIVGEDL